MQMLMGHRVVLRVESLWSVTRSPLRGGPSSVRDRHAAYPADQGLNRCPPSQRTLPCVQGGAPTDKALAEMTEWAA